MSFYEHPVKTNDPFFFFFLLDFPLCFCCQNFILICHPYFQAKRRLDYQLELANVERNISQKNMASWITDGVLKSITPAQEQESLKKCIQDLKALSATA